MDYPRLSLWFLFIFNFLVSLTTPQPLAYNRCSTSGNYTTTSTYAANLNEFLSSIPTSSDLNSDGFFNTTIGQSPNQVYAIGLCRGGQTVTSCRSCLSASILAIIQSCPNQKEASGGYDECRLMFSNHNVLRSTEYYLLYFRCGNSAGNMAQFNDVLDNLLFSLRDRAAAAPRKYAVDKANYTIFQNIYGLAQCMPEVSEPDCRSGYMAPEYALYGQFSVKSDVFSFGVLVLEIVSGQKNNCFGNGDDVEDLLSYVSMILEDTLLATLDLT
ncbi:hypothetical protein RJ640_005507 [Escallonia rubra]|uniref:Gnk2-homologous domain-containing protein n=1 Tax=Escallonia rubra TaxID=112253 RepID=A0AA88RNH0_9ASTE|nr:hypothetical protein RJ640_005507 [Escallonia rubra]